MNPKRVSNMSQAPQLLSHGVWNGTLLFCPGILLRCDLLMSLLTLCVAYFQMRPVRPLASGSLDPARIYMSSCATEWEICPCLDLQPGGLLRLRRWEFALQGHSAEKTATLIYFQSEQKLAKTFRANLAISGNLAFLVSDLMSGVLSYRYTCTDTK